MINYSVSEIKIYPGIVYNKIKIKKEKLFSIVYEQINKRIHNLTFVSIRIRYFVLFK